MPIYHCDLCNFSTPLKSNYTSHLSTKKHILLNKIKQINSPIKAEVPESKVIEKVSPEFVCNHCNRKFAFRQSMNRHIKYNCTKNKDEDLRKQVYLLKKQLDEQQQLLDEQEKLFTKMIDDLSEKIENIKGNVVINDSFNNNIQNIYVTYHASVISKLTDQDEEYNKDYTQEIKG